jgi:hypothetical protein
MFVPGNLTNAIAISSCGSQSGACFNVALRADGTVAAWGDNQYGQTNVPPGMAEVVEVAGGFAHGVARKSDTTVAVWGRNEYGQRNVPVYLTNVVAIAGGSRHTLAITVGLVIWSRPSPIISLVFGAETNLCLAVSSGSAFGCQWLFNGAPIAGAIETNLVVSQFDLTKAGAYSVCLTNQFSSYTTAVSVVRLVDSPVVLVNGIDEGGGKVDRVDSAPITMSSGWGDGAHIYYTLDGSGPDYTDLPYSGDFTVTNSVEIRAIAYNSDYTASAEAAPISVQIWPTYVLTATTAGGGIVGVAPNAYSQGNLFVSNTVVTLTAMPSPGWSFLYWMGDTASTSNVTSVVMDRPRNLEAVFGVSVRVFTNGNGQVVLNPSEGPYSYGSSVQLTALPSAGGYFFGWAGGASGFGNPYMLTVTNATGITALFGALGPDHVSLTVLPSGGGSVLVNPSANVYTNGQVVFLTAVAGNGRVFNGWGGDVTGTLNPAALTLDSSKVVTASF